MCGGSMINAALLYVVRMHVQPDEIVQVALRGKRSWCIVTSVDGDTITGIVDDSESNGLAAGSIVFFSRNQILDVRDDLHVDKHDVTI